MFNTRADPCCSVSHCSMRHHMKRNIFEEIKCDWPTVWVFCNFLAVVSGRLFQNYSCSLLSRCCQRVLMFCYVSNEPAALPSPLPLFFPVSCVCLGVGWLASWLCHWLVIFPGQVWRVEVVAEGGGGGGGGACWSTFCIQLSAKQDTDEICLLLAIWLERRTRRAELQLNPTFIIV